MTEPGSTEDFFTICDSDPSIGSGMDSPPHNQSLGKEFQPPSEGVEVLERSDEQSPKSPFVYRVVRVLEDNVLSTLSRQFRLWLSN